MGWDYYDVLGVEKSASSDEIKAAFREKIKAHHPDQNDDERAHLQVRALTEARDVLTDPKERRRYERLGHETYVKQHGTAIFTPDRSNTNDTTSGATESKPTSSARSNRVSTQWSRRSAWDSDAVEDLFTPGPERRSTVGSFPTEPFVDPVANLWLRSWAVVLMAWPLATAGLFGSGLAMQHLRGPLGAFGQWITAAGTTNGGRLSLVLVGLFISLVAVEIGVIVTFPTRTNDRKLPTDRTFLPLFAIVALCLGIGLHSGGFTLNTGGVLTVFGGWIAITTGWILGKRRPNQRLELTALASVLGVGIPTILLSPVGDASGSFLPTPVVHLAVSWGVAVGLPVLLIAGSLYIWMGRYRHGLYDLPAIWEWLLVWPVVAIAWTVIYPETVWELPQGAIDITTMIGLAQATIQPYRGGSVAGRWLTIATIGTISLVLIRQLIGRGIGRLR